MQGEKGFRENSFLNRMGSARIYVGFFRAE